MSVSIKISAKNLLKWGGFEDWVDGASAAPTEFTLSGAGAAVARESTIIKEGTYSCKLTRGGADVSLYHDLPEYDSYQGRKLTLGVWVYCGTASRARIALGDDVGTTNSSYHSGVAGWERLTVTRNIDSAATRIRTEMHVNTGDVIGYFDAVFLGEGTDDITILTDIADVSNWKPKNKYRAQVAKVTRKEGIKLPNYILEQKTIQIKGKIIGTTPLLYRDNMDTFQAVVNSNIINQDGDRELKDLYLFDDRLQEVYVSNLSTENIAALRIANFSLSLMTVNPFYKYYQMTRSKNTIASDPDYFTISPLGTAITRPIIKVTNSTGGAVTSIVVSNLTSDQSFAYSGSLADGDVLEVDTDLLSIENDGVDDLANFSGDTDMILLPGGNEIVVTGLSAGILEIDYFDRWF